MYGCKSRTIRKAECQRIDAFELWCWRRLLRVPWTARRSNQSILKEISPEYSLEGLVLKLKLILATWIEELTHLKRPWCWERLRAGGAGDDREWDGGMASPMMDMSLRELWELVVDREACHAATHGVQHARLPCPSPTPRVYSNSCPPRQWCHPTISSSVIPVSSCL